MNCLPNFYYKVGRAALKVQQDRKPYFWFTQTYTHWGGRCGNPLVHTTNRSVTSALQGGVPGEFPRPTPALSAGPRDFVVPHVPSSQGCSLAGSSDAQGTGQPGLCSLNIHFMEPFLWIAKDPCVGWGAGSAGNFTSPKSDLGLKTLRLFCLPSRPPFSLWQGSQPTGSPFFRHPGPLLSEEG